MKNYAIGVDIGGTKCSVVLGKGRIPDSGLEDFILDKICFPTEAAGIYNQQYYRCSV